MSAVEFVEALSEGPDGEGASQAGALFQQAYGQEPKGVWSAPGRVNLIGEHTDYNAGLCLPIALPHRTFLALSPRDDDQVRLVSSFAQDRVEQTSLEGLEAGGVEGWAAYPVGVAWALRRAGFGQVRGFDAAFVSCVPVGSGLSSSAAMTCSTALALDDVYGLGFGGSDAGRLTLIDAAMVSENEMAGASTGGLDQSASMRCQAGYAIELDFQPGLSALESAKQVPFDLRSRDLELLVLDTQAPHQLNDGQYDARRRSCELAAQTLGVENLRVVADQVEAADDPERALKDVLDKLDDPTQRKRVRHVVTEIGRVGEFIRAFRAGDIRRAGELFNASHDSLRDDYEVTVPELDLAVDVARANGAYGARMTGGGFGGSIIALVDAGRSREMAAAVAEEFSRRGFRQPRALAALPSQPAEREA
ncbi:Galactokinase [Bifidobacterium actinocoloniiforme DSM 22766]|uniref:Galactokinase n=1 Tax=Bifidobacterium actinocoloniiforme DSM 22766 TaxID=1437605 RepID=A0A086YZE6_9BIFI|nr:galactokinase [Bifidobacterium actinocoloniiforme]AKV54983.1 galactokinase [Bifidobacterium actinocoloniiforme DSM 22766]KFI39646.1 Galactokinase [Bifidobacterium actinocoloniiforme DSM 22766]